MAVNSIIPKGSKLAVVGGIFKAQLNNPVPGVYDFTDLVDANGNRINCAVGMGLQMSPNYLYFFHQLNFSLSIDEGTFLSAIQSGTVPTLVFRDSISRKAVFDFPIRLFRYYEGNAIDKYYHNFNANNFLYGDFQCLLSQTSDLQGIDTIYAQVSASVYEITNEKFIKEYKRETA